MADGTSTQETSRTTSVLFIDLVGSTALAATLGDAAWAALLVRYKHTVRDQLEGSGGREMDDAGDGFFIVFGHPGGAVAYALAVAEALRPLDLEIRGGIHTGDCVLAGDKCTGLAVHVGARLLAHASPGELVLSEAARRLVAPDVPVVDRGVVELRDVPGEWRAYSIAMRSSAEPATAS